MNIQFSKSLQSRIAKRANDLDMTPSVYVKQCVLSELNKSYFSTLTAGKDTPALKNIDRFTVGAEMSK